MKTEKKKFLLTLLCAFLLLMAIFFAYVWFWGHRAAPKKTTVAVCGK